MQAIIHSCFPLSPVSKLCLLTYNETIENFFYENKQQQRDQSSKNYDFTQFLESKQISTCYRRLCALSISFSVFHVISPSKKPGIRNHQPAVVDGDRISWNYIYTKYTVHIQKLYSLYGKSYTYRLLLLEG